MILSVPCATVTAMNPVPSDTQQRNSVSEGTALGLTMLGCWEIPYDKVAVDLAFTGAFRGWPQASLFPRVQSDLTLRWDGTSVMTRVDRRKSTYLLHWERARTLTIHRRISDWDVNDADDLDFAGRLVDEQLPTPVWEDLARRLLDRYSP